MAIGDSEPRKPEHRNELESSEVEVDVRLMQGTPKKTSEVKFDLLRATAEAEKVAGTARAT